MGASAPQIIGMTVYRCYIDDRCDSCGERAVGRLGVAFGVGRAGGCPVICFLCIKMAGMLLPMTPSAEKHDKLSNLPCGHLDRAVCSASMCDGKTAT